MVNNSDAAHPKPACSTPNLTWKMSMWEEWAIEDMLGVLFFPRINWIA